MRGSVHRSQIATSTQKYDFKKNVANWRTVRSTGTASRNFGTCQPPRKSVVMIAPIRYRFPHSAMKKRMLRMPLYSVAKPATSSDSASGKSNGVRLPSASAEMKNTGKAKNVNGFANRFHVHG